VSKFYTQQEIKEICLAFAGKHGSGLINEIVLAGHKRERVCEVNAQELVEFFSSFECAGVAKLIRTLNTPQQEKLSECGSHTIDFYGVTKGEFSLANATTLVGITIGSQKKNISPTQWLYYLAKGFYKLSKIQRDGFDIVCVDFANLNEALSSGKGIREIDLNDL